LVGELFLFLLQFVLLVFDLRHLLVVEGGDLRKVVRGDTLNALDALVGFHHLLFGGVDFQQTVGLCDGVLQGVGDLLYFGGLLQYLFLVGEVHLMGDGNQRHVFVRHLY